MLRKLKVSMKEFIDKSKLNSSNLPQKYLKKKKTKTKAVAFSQIWAKILERCSRFTCSL